MCIGFFTIKTALLPFHLMYLPFQNVYKQKSCEKGLLINEQKLFGLSGYMVKHIYIMNTSKSKS